MSFSQLRKFIDIGANLTDAMYAGVYCDTEKHKPDLEQVLERSWEAGLTKIIMTGCNLEESQRAFELAKTDDRLYFTVGCHPTRCSEFEEKGHDAREYLEKLTNVISSAGDKVVAIGECGLDYERTQFCPKDIQRKYFEYQLELTKSFKLPLFLHCRNAANDLYDILSKYDSLTGVVHSFDGTAQEAQRFIDLGYYIGLNGCSIKTLENLETVKTLPKDRILLETDCPWCEIKTTHAGFQFITEESQLIPKVKKEKWRPEFMVKGRNEPNNIRQVLDVLSRTRNEDPDLLCEKIYENTLKLFFPSESP